MKPLYRIAAAALAVLLISGCANRPPTATPEKAAIKTAYDTVSAYAVGATSLLARGRITEAQAEQASANAKKARKRIASAEAALAMCKPPAPCTNYINLMQGLQPTLIEFERELRRQQGEKK